MLIQRQRGPAVEANGVLDSQPPHEQQHQGSDDLRSAQGPAGAAAAAVNDHICRHRIFKGQRPVDQSLFTCQALADPVHSNFSFPPEGSHSPVIYPAAILANTELAEQAERFMTFLQDLTAKGVFEAAGFTVVE